MKKFFKNNLKMFFLVITIVLISCNKNKDNSCDCNNKDNFSLKDSSEKLSPRERKIFLEELCSDNYKLFLEASDVVFVCGMEIEKKSKSNSDSSLEKPRKFIKNSIKDIKNFFDAYDIVMEKESHLISKSDVVVFDSLTRSLMVNMDSVMYYMKSLQLPVEKQLPN